MTITAKIIADSISDAGIRITTMECRYPRFIHAEFLTHRMFSRNASSSRAIPVQKMIDDVINDPAVPSHWGKNQPGMQAKEEHNADVRIQLKDDNGVIEVDTAPLYAWIQARNNAVEIALAFAEAGYHKQLTNRLLEPFSHITVCITSTQWSNFFALRCHEDAQPEIRILAETMRAAQESSIPKLLKWGEWHLPYVLDGDMAALGGDIELARRVSAARCARTSYKTHDGRISKLEEDINLCDRLIGGVPLHASPFEHICTPDNYHYNEFDNIVWDRPDLHGNFTGWQQFRKMLKGECQ